MEWTDTLMLDAASPCKSSEAGPVMDYTRVVALHGITLLCTNATSRPEIAATLELLRGFRATDRRVVLCDTSRLVVGRQFGHEVVESGAAQMLISCGISGREVGTGARDAGLTLANVVVCSKPLAGGQVLASRLSKGDRVLLLGIDSETCGELVAMLTQRLSGRTVVAA